MELRNKKIIFNNFNVKVNQINVNKKKLYLRRDSFSDRFCDDLCEVIVSYLSFEDKIRFECVSHQFQRLLFNKQYSLEVIKWGSNLKTKNCLNYLLKDIIRGINLIAFESVLNKCKFINKIVINGIECENREKVLQLLSKYVKHLKSIEFDFQYINEKVLLEFGEECGQKLENINFSDYSNYDYKPLLKLCPNIRSLTHIRLFDIIENNDLLVPKLVSVKELDINSDNNLFEIFFNKTGNRLKCFGNCFYDYVKSERFESFQQIVWNKISNYFNLQELHLYFQFMEWDQYLHLNEVFNCIGFKCNKINKLTLDLHDYSFENKNIEFFKTFSQLKYLTLNFSSNFTIKSLENCKQLTHLRVNSYDLRKDTFNEIDVYLPQLTHLSFILDKSIDYDYDSDNGFDNYITDSVFKSLSKLKFLKCLIIKISSDDYEDFGPTDEGICDVINNCPQFASLRFSLWSALRFSQITNISHKTFDALISLAERKPFCDFVHSFGEDIECPQNMDYLEFITNEKNKTLPKNMKIIPFDVSMDLNQWF